MERMVNGVVFEGNYVENAWDVRIFKVNGHREVSARPVIEWSEKMDLGFHYEFTPLDPENESDARLIAEKKERSIKAAARRAQTQCRRIIKASDFREMLTITYRENQGDRDLCREHFSKWVRAMVYAYPKFKYCASFERQDRGAMHVHLACKKLPKKLRYKGELMDGWRVPTLIWRKIVGDDNGLVFVGAKPRWAGEKRRKNMSLAKMASYISKYIMKDYAEWPEGTQRYVRSEGIQLPKPEHVRLTNCTLTELVELCFDCGDGEIVVSHRVGKWGDSYWLCTEPVLL